LPADQNAAEERIVSDLAVHSVRRAGPSPYSRGSRGGREAAVHIDGLARPGAIKTLLSHRFHRPPTVALALRARGIPWLMSTSNTAGMHLLVSPRLTVKWLGRIA